MIDGVKFDNPTSLATQWLNSHLLEFNTPVSIKTGEVVDTTAVATYRGLKFFIRSNRETGRVSVCEVQGSLHKYKNNGKHNADDFTFEDLQEVIADLNAKFGINPDTADLHNLEFGVNIHTPITATELLKNLVAYGTKEIGTLKVEGKTVGKQIDLTKKALKIYDKGKQYKLPENNLVRFEVSVNKMKPIEDYNIKTLSDLISRTKISPLINELTKWWDSLIYYDKSINLKHLTPTKQKRLLYYATPRNWADFCYQQRWRAKDRYNKLMQEFGSNNQSKITALIVKKWKELTAEKCRDFTQVQKQEVQQKNVEILPVRIEGYFLYKNNIEIEKVNRTKKARKTPQKTPPILANAIYPSTSTKKAPEIESHNPRNCKCCGKDITHKSKIAVYCSKRCNNKVNGQKRTKRQKQQRKAENIALSKAIEHYQSKGIEWLTIETRTPEDIQKAVKLSPSEIRADRATINTIVRVTIILTDKRTKKPLILNAGRCRKLIRIINKSNIANELQETGTITQNQRKAKKQGARNESPKKTPAKIRTA
ncbi:hypothetical protein PG623_08910 [Riemerella anatipestifer]|nr:hypothetical protein [Riemerella anatipestifer]